MKNKYIFVLLGGCLLGFIVSSGWAQGSSMSPSAYSQRGVRLEEQPLTDTASLATIGTGFTYQGQLKNNAGYVNGTCDFQFGLWDDASAGTQIGSTQTKTNVMVKN